MFVYLIDNIYVIYISIIIEQIQMVVNSNDLDIYG